jgi:spermidine synthase
MIKSTSNKGILNMKNFIYNEMISHLPLCTHKEPKSVLIISDDANELQKEIQKHDGIDLDILGYGVEKISKAKDNQYDVVICEDVVDAFGATHINRVLKDDGLLSMKHPPLDEIEANKTLMQILANYFKIIMPYNLGNCSTALLASKEYHPTADIILQRADMLDGLDYYNCDVHVGSFAMGNHIRKEYLGIIKN